MNHNECNHDNMEHVDSHTESFEPDTIYEVLRCEDCDAEITRVFNNPKIIDVVPQTRA